MENSDNGWVENAPRMTFLEDLRERFNFYDRDAEADSTNEAKLRAIRQMICP
jgi:hypothetical protein